MKIKRNKELSESLNGRVVASSKNVIKHDHEEDSTLSDQDFIKKHFNLIKEIAFAHTLRLPPHLRSTMRDDMESNAFLYTLHALKYWELVEGGRKKRNWVIYVLHRCLKKYRNSVVLKSNNSILKDDVAIDTVGGCFSESVLEGFLRTLSVRDTSIFMSYYCDGKTIKDTAKSLKKRKEYVRVKVKKLKEDFIQHLKRITNSNSGMEECSEPDL